ncbi:MAG: three-Cys-motif partner protein TcmP [Alphaproteobacteria bacterium]|nr:three-Cys-motif partner protein TcmP [Alphaproteobacteria bacterium]
MAQKRFGSADSTGRKLDVIEKYLSMYQKALSNTRLQTLYIDGFAGSGEVPLGASEEDLFDEEVKTVLAGSADRALSISPPFLRYVFIDKRKKCIDALKARLKDRPNFDRVETTVEDANAKIRAICENEQWRMQRGVVLLDPFGSQVEWATIEAIAATKALDLWYLFPAGLSVFRQIANDGTVHDSHGDSITRLFGTDVWMTAFFAPSSQGDLFGEPAGNRKNVTPESAARFMIERLRNVFRGGVLELEETIPLGRHAYPSYYLLFAWANPAPKATELAKKLARAAIRATDRKHGRPV